ncbi:MAG: hypothetical protein PHD51_02185 [Patescibacteria group bacterium]|nr:hypothetical protein [Patescibacteria group bacterium]MDD5490330.1 hypothetical protein [Patescibacteria group bacterium]
MAETETFRVISASSSYGVVVVVSPEDAKPGDKEAKFFLRNLNVGIKDFEPVTEDVALGYFSGIADGLGRGKKPANHFNSLKEVAEWADKANEQAMKELIRRVKES